MKYYIQNTEIYSVEYELGEGYNLSANNSVEDFQAGKIVSLSDKQVAFLQLNPGASTLEILQCKLNIYQPILEEVKSQKIAAIDAYDCSEEVNSFLLNNKQIWLDRNTRAALANTINSFRQAGIDSITLWTAGEHPQSILMKIEDLSELLVSLELYAKNCYDVTARHKVSVQNLITIEDVNIYDYRQGYPEKLSIKTT